MPFYLKSTDSIKNVNYSVFLKILKLFHVNNLRNDEVVRVSCNI